MGSFCTMRVDQTRFESCYDLLRQIFPPDELVNRAEYDYLLAHPTRDHEFLMLARDDGQSLVGVVAGSYLSLTPPPNPLPVHREGGNALNSVHFPSPAGEGLRVRASFAMIEYLAVKQNGQGHGSALLNAFEQTMHELAAERNERLIAVVGEVEEDLLPFKFKTGYRLPEKVWYAQPPIEFDSDGRPLHPALPKLLMVKPFPDADQIEADLLRRIVTTIYHKRYIPLSDELTMKRIEAFIFTQIYPQFDASLLQRSMIRLDFRYSV